MTLKPHPADALPLPEAARLEETNVGARIYVYGQLIPTYPIGTAYDAQKQLLVDAINTAAINARREGYELAMRKAQEGREPVAWRVRRSDGEHELFFHEPTAKQRAECFVPHSSAEPLYTSPPPKSDEARDAERYRVLRDFDSGKTELAICRWSEHGWVGEWVIEHDPDAAIDAAIDAALAAQQKGKK